MSLAPIIAANRFGLGARPRELTDIGGDPQGWLIKQITGSRSAPAEMNGLPSSAAAIQAFADALRQSIARKQAAGGEKMSADKPDGEGEPAKRMENARKQIAGMYQEQVAARYRLAARTEESFRERLVHFWTNHFAVSADKAQVVGVAATLEYEAVRPHLAGSFIDLLLAVESHPAMILYLDNRGSLGPNSPIARRAEARAGRDRKLDINENLAREILELHTVGVNGGYTQADVTTFALALTGWSVAGKPGKESQSAGRFYFREAAHEPGAKTILGKRYSQEGIEQARAVLKDLANHPATAKHVATKLARHFIADEPPAAAVERLAKVFRDTAGDLPSLHRALVESPEAWQTPVTKFKTPHDFVVSTFRMLDFVPAQPQQILTPFQLLGQKPYSPGSPAGWPDTANEWDGPDALLKRIEWASAIGNRMGSKAQPLESGAYALGAALSERTRMAISRAQSSAQGFALLLASPEFQRR